MLGGHSSFGAGGWADTPLDRHPPRRDPPRRRPARARRRNQVRPQRHRASTATSSRSAPTRPRPRGSGTSMPPILGTNRFGEPKHGADILAETPGAQPRTVDAEHGVGTTAASSPTAAIPGSGPLLGGGPARPSQVLAADHLLALAQGERQRQPGQADPRRPPDRVGREDRADRHRPRRQGRADPERPLRDQGRAREGRSRRLQSRSRSSTRATKAKGSIYATDNSASPATTRPPSSPSKDGQEIGRDTARFLVYQDDRELENPSADLAPGPADRRVTDGESVTPERLATHLKGIDRSAYTEYVSPPNTRSGTTGRSS